jgi:hypothetical protein
MPTIADSKCGNPLIFMQEGGRNRVRLRVYLKRLSFVIWPEIGFGSGGPLPPFGTPDFLEISTAATH